MPKDGSEAAHKLLTYSPMLHSRLFKEDAKYRQRMFEPTREWSTVGPSMSQPDIGSGVEECKDVDGNTLFLDGHLIYDRPLTVQFCSNDPEHLLGAARHVAPYCDAVDLNLGCPQGIARKGHYGAFLQEDWSLIHSLIKRLHCELDVPVTAKMRILETREKTLEYAKMILDAGASILTVHGRRREQKGHITGVADWAMLRYLRDNLPPETVLFANGNILQHDDIQRCLDATGFDGVMSAEGNLCDPSVLAPPPKDRQEPSEYWRGRDGMGGYRMDAVMRRYFDIIYRHALEVEPPQRNRLFVPGDANTPVKTNSPAQTPSKKRTRDDDISDKRDNQPPAKKQKSDKSIKRQHRTQSPNLLAMRPHLFSMLRPLVAKHTHVRDALARASPGDMETFEHVLQLTEAVIAEALVEYDNGNEDVAKHAEKKKAKDSEPPLPDEHDVMETSVATVKRCWRPWWVCQPHVRPLPAEALANGSVKLGKKAKKQLQKDERLAKDVGLAPNGSSKAVETNGTVGEKVEVPKEGLACG